MENKLKELIGDEFYTRDKKEKDFHYVDWAEDFVGVYFGDYLTPSSVKYTPVLSDFLWADQCKIIIS